MRARSLLVILLFAQSSVAFTYETDQLTWRHKPLPDSNEKVSRYVNESLERAAFITRKQMKSNWSDQRIADTFRKNVLKLNSFDMKGFGATTEIWMRENLEKTGYASKPVFDDGKDRNIYIGYKSMFCGFFQHPTLSPFVFHGALKRVGRLVAPTVMVNGVRFGTDKMSHLLRLGYRLYKRSHHGTDVKAAIHYATWTENTYLGTQFTGVFSYGDIAADYAGYQFYRDLIASDNPSEVHGEAGAHYRIERGRPGSMPQLVQARPFELKSYVTDDWDEYLNPSAYTPALQKVINDHLLRYRDLICSEYRIWGPVSGKSKAHLMPLEEYIDISTAPTQVDPFQLDKLCQDVL